MLAVEVEELVKCYGRQRALDAVSFAVPAGTVLGMLGPNGAGKTTAVRVLATLIDADGGRARVHGYDVARQPQQVRALIGLTGQFAAVDDDLSGQENLYLIARLSDLPARAARARAAGMLERFSLGGAAGKLVRQYSGGMRRRLDLAACLVSDPQVIYLDEPTTGLDPHSRNTLWGIVRERVDEGSTVLLTTQYMEEAEALADDVVVVDHGRVIARGSPLELRRRVGGQSLRIRPRAPADLGRLAAALERAGLPGAVDQEAGTVSLTIVDATRLDRALAVVVGCGVNLAAIDTCIPSLDEVFLTLTDGGAPA